MNTSTLTRAKIPLTLIISQLFFSPRCYRPELKGFKVNIIGLSGRRMSSKVLCTSTWRGFSTRKFSSICRNTRRAFMSRSSKKWWKESVNVCMSHVDEEDLHLGFRYSSSQTLTRAEAEAQTFEVVLLRSQPAGRLVLFWSEKHFWVSAHGVQT